MVSILSRGIIGLNHKCIEKYFKDYKYVIFFFDRDNKITALKPTNDLAGNTYIIRLTGNQKGSQISASAFLKHYKIDV